jgi:hypothetical protein
MSPHPCLNHINRCPAVIAAGGDTAARLRAEVEQGARLRAAIASEVSATPTFPMLVAFDGLSGLVGGVLYRAVIAEAGRLPVSPAGASTTSGSPALEAARQAGADIGSKSKEVVDVPVARRQQ